MNFCARILYIAGCVLSLSAVDAMGTDLATKTRTQETVRGYLVDAVCVKEEAVQLTELGPKHTKKCIQMPACRESGYALLLPSNNDVLHFDKHGNDLAIGLVKSHRLESGWRLQATGKRRGDQFAVATLELAPKPPVKRRKQ
jgi:hypothetical protein